MQINNTSPELIWGPVLSCPQSYDNTWDLVIAAHTTCHCCSSKVPGDIVWWPGSLITACECRSHVRTQICGGVNATAEYNRVEPFMNRDLIGKYLCTCTFFKGCIQLTLQRADWKSTAYPLFTPIRGYCYPFGPESLANVQIVFVEETENWIVYKHGSNPPYLQKMYFS